MSTGTSTSRRRRDGVLAGTGAARGEAGAGASSSLVVRDRERRRAAVLAGLLFAVAAGVYTVLALRCPVPDLLPDELRYTHLARSIAEGQRMKWHGEAVDQRAALYVYFLVPAWRVFQSTTDAYAATKVLGSLALCLSVVPVYLLARELVRPQLALLPAVLTLAGTWMLNAAMTVTEVLAFPLATAALCVTPMALRRRGGALPFVALGFAVLATWARFQLIVLIPVVLGAFVFDVLLATGRRREVLRAHRPILATAGALTALLAIVAVADHAVVGDYEELYVLHASVSTLWHRAGLQLLELVVVGGFVPVLLSVVASGSRRAWRDDRVGPVLIVFWLATAAFVAQSGWYLAGISTYVTTGIERYVFYVAPVAFVLMTVLVAEPRLLPRRAYAVAGVLAVALLAMPAVAFILIEPATWSTSYRVGQLTGLTHGTALALAGVTVVGVAWVIARRARGRPGVAATATAGLVLLVLAVQGQANWHHLTTVTRSARALLPADAQWIDHHTDAPVALFTVETTSATFGHLELFNRSVAAVFVRAGGQIDGAGLSGGVCQWDADRSGAVRFGCPSVNLAQAPTHFLINDPRAHVRFRDEVASASDRRVGRLVAVDPGAAPRLRSIVVTPCNAVPLPYYAPTAPVILPPGSPEACHSQLEAFLWQDAPAVLSVRVRGSARDHTLRMGARTWRVPARREVTVRMPVRQGPSRLVWQTDWPTTADAPAIVSVDLAQDGHRSSLL